MNCVESKPLVGAYADGELDLAHSVDIERHIEGCAACSTTYRNALALRALVRDKIPAHRAPASLRVRVKAITSESVPSRAGIVVAKPARPRPPVWGWIGAAAAFALVLLVGLRATNVWGPSQDSVLAGEVESAHVRSLMANHLMDVPSTDQHTVKPWFHGKLDFAPPVADFSAQGFPLVGGRLDYIHGRGVASLVYQRRQHPINLFVWPDSSAKDSDVKEISRDGYNILHWTRGGMTYWAVSDLAIDEMRQFVNLLRG